MIPGPIFCNGKCRPVYGSSPCSADMIDVILLRVDIPAARGRIAQDAVADPFVIVGIQPQLLQDRTAG